MGKLYFNTDTELTLDDEWCALKSSWRTVTNWNKNNKRTVRKSHLWKWNPLNSKELNIGPFEREVYSFMNWSNNFYVFWLKFLNKFLQIFSRSLPIQWQLVSSQIVGGWPIVDTKKNELVQWRLLIRFYFQWFEYGWVNHFHRCESERK